MHGERYCLWVLDIPTGRYMGNHLAISHYLSKQKIGFDSRRFAVEFITNMRIR